MEITDEHLYNDYRILLQTSMDKKHIAVSILLGVVVLLSLVGNILVVVISVHYVGLRSLISVFTLNLALSDLLFTVGLPFWVCDYIWRLDLGDAVCIVYRCFSSVGFYSSVILLVLMSVQRYMAMAHPLSGWKKGGSVKEVLICVWVMSILAAVPGAVHADANHYLGGCKYSSITAFVANAYKTIVVFVCAFLFMAFFYIRILKNIFKSTTNQGHRTTGLAFTLVATYFVFWAPYYIMTFLYILSDYHQIGCFILKWPHFYYGWYICCVLVLARCCLNPLIYALFGLKFRKTTQEIFRTRATSNPAQMRNEVVRFDSDVILNN